MNRSKETNGGSKVKNDPNEKSEYASSLAAMDEKALVEETEMKCWLSAYATNNPRSAYHWQTDACYDEAKSRGKLWLYQRGWNAAYRSAGYEVSESNLKAAQEPMRRELEE